MVEELRNFFPAGLDKLAGSHKKWRPEEIREVYRGSAVHNQFIDVFDQIDKPIAIPADPNIDLKLMISGLANEVSSLKRELTEASERQALMLDDMHAIVLALSQRYFWNDTWQESEAKVDAQIDAQQLHGPKDPEQLIDHLRKKYG